MGMVRTFVAIQPPGDVQQALGKLLHELRQSGADVRWESHEKLHATITFLGDVDESRLPLIYASAERIAAEFVPFEVVFENIGGFPDVKRPRVIWVGCTVRGGSLERFKRRFDDALVLHGFKREDRPFSPHVTLGRVKSSRGAENLLSLMEYLTFEPISASINGIVVLKSVLKPLGAQYSLLHSIRIPPT